MTMFLQKLYVDWYLQAHVLSAFDWQPVPGVVVNHLRDGQEPAGKVAQLKVSVHSVPSNPHVHVSSGTPAQKQ